MSQDRYVSIYPTVTTPSPHLVRIVTAVDVYMSAGHKVVGCGPAQTRAYIHTEEEYTIVCQS